MASFLDYYEDELRKRGLSSSSQAAPAPTSSIKPFQGKKTEPKDLFSDTSNPIGWTLDMLSRPLFGVTEAINSTVEEGAAIGKALKEGDLEALLARDPSKSPGAAFFRGLTSNNEDDKRYFGETIENSTDIVGAANPNYVDTEDNVNPVLKGVLGLAGDIALDPLTYIPGAQLAKIGGMIGQGAKAAATGAKGAVKGATEAVRGAKATKAVEEVAQETADLAPAISKLDEEQSLAEAFTMPAARQESPTPSVGPQPSVLDEILVPATGAPSSTVLVPAKALPATKAVEAAVTGKSLSQIIKESPRTAPLQAEVKNLLAFLDGKNLDAVKPAAVAPVDKDMMVFDFVQKYADKPITAQLPGDAAKRPYTMTELSNISQNVSSKGRASAAGKILSTLASRQSKADSVTENVLTGVDAVQQRLASGERALRNVLGDDVFDQISRLSGSGKNQAALRRTLVRLDSIVGGRVTDLEALAKTSGGRQLVDNVRATYSTPFSEARGTVKTPEQVTELAQQIELSPVSDAFRRTLLEENIPSSPEFRAKYTEFAHGNPVAKDGKTADWWRQTNTFTQYGMYKRLQGYIDDSVRSVGGLPRSEMFGAQRAAAQRRAVEDLGGQIADAMETFGTPLYIGVGDNLTRLTFPEVYRTVGRAMDELFETDVTNLALHNQGTALAMTRFMNVVNEAVSNPATGVEELAAFIRKTTVDSAGGNASKTLDNNLMKKGATGYFYPTGTRAKELAARVGGYTAKGRSGKGNFVKIDNGGNLPEMLAEAIVAARPLLAEMALKNADDWAARGISEAQALAGNMLRKVGDLAKNPSKAAQREQAILISRREREIADEAAAMAATPEGTNIATVSTDAALGDAAIKEADIYTRQGGALESGTSMEDAGWEAALTRDRIQVDVDEMLQSARISPDVEVPSSPGEIAEKLDIGEMAVEAIQGAMVGTFGQRAGKIFDRNYGLDPALHDDLMRAGTWSGEVATRDFIRPLKAIARRGLSPKAQVNAVKAVQQNIRLVEGTAEAQLADEFAHILGHVFDLSGSNSPLGNMFTESGASVDELNSLFRYAFDGSERVQFDFAGAKDAAKISLGAGTHSKKDMARQIAVELKEQWRQWDLSDPIADIARIGMAASRLAEHRAVTANFINTGLKHGFVKRVPHGQKVPAGFVKAVSTSNSTPITKGFPKDIYISKEIAPSLARMEYLTLASRLPDGAFGEWIRSTVTPLTNAWKQGMTIYRLGHHIRNFIGNMSLQYVARGSRDFSKSATAAMKLMARDGSHPGVDFLQMLRTMGDETVPSGGEIIVRGRFGDISADEIRNWLSKEGLKPTYEASEGLLSADVKTGGAVERIVRPLDAANNPVGRLGAKVSESVDHYARYHHAIQALMQEASKRGGRWKGKSKAEVMRLIATEVRRAHPDSSMLTASENKYAKLLIPFYSWLRGVLPFAIESAMQNPGRVLAFPKASYNAAIAAGLNPDSLADPFPEDQLFPSFIRESTLGPQFQIDGNYIRMNPGFAHLDIAESLGLGSDNPVEGLGRGVLGMVNPLVRVPAEIASGGSWSTGGRISDTSDYIDQSIPLVNYLSNLTGMSLTGSVASLPTGTGLDPQAQVAKGNKTDFDKGLAALNWLSGLGFQNLSRPNYINYAEIEKRNAASEQK